MTRYQILATLTLAIGASTIVASFVDPRFERIWLPLRAGVNEIVLAVTDDQLFGWGASMSM